MFSRSATNAQPRNLGTDGDVLFDQSGNIYSVTTLNNILTVIKQNLLGVKVTENSYGTVTGTPLTKIGQAIYTPNDGEKIYVAGSSQGTSLTASSLTYNIYLQKINVADLTSVWTKNWGLDGANQDDYAHAITLTPDGGKILVVGYTKSFLHPT